jgi:hypothetical protein
MVGQFHVPVSVMGGSAGLRAGLDAVAKGNIVPEIEHGSSSKSFYDCDERLSCFIMTYQLEVSNETVVSGEAGESVVVCLKLLSSHSPGGIWENHEETQDSRAPDRIRTRGLPKKNHTRYIRTTLCAL